jgi:hypothetical protein
MSTSQHLPLRECGYAIAVVVVLLVLYGGAYLAMMERVDVGISSKAGEQTPIALYRFGGESTPWFFGPAHEVDRWIRPELWRNERVFRPDVGRPGFYSIDPARTP